MVYVSSTLLPIFPVLGLTLWTSDLGRTQGLFFTLILSDKILCEFIWGEKKKGKDKQQDIIQGIALKWLAWGQGPSTPRAAGLVRAGPYAFHQAARTSIGEGGEEPSRAE